MRTLTEVLALASPANQLCGLVLVSFETGHDTPFLRWWL
jgi:hypothetical protein